MGLADAAARPADATASSPIVSTATVPCLQAGEELAKSRAWNEQGKADNLLAAAEQEYCEAESAF